MIPDEILQKIDDETDIVALASEFISLEKRGKNYMGLCPFHDENTPSFSVTPEKNIAMCMSCGEGGRPINFYRKIKNIDFGQAVKELGERLGIDVKIDTNETVNTNQHLYEIMNEASSFYQYNLFNSVSGEKVLEYLANRKLSNETIKHFELGYSPKEKDSLYQFLKSKNYSVSDMINLGLVKQSNDGTYYDLFTNRLMFPITNSFGKTIAFSGRTLDKNDKVKYVNSPETLIFKKGETVYHLAEAGLDIRKKKFVMLYEGFFDVISPYQAGFPNGVATMGTALTINQARLIKKTVDKVIVAYDGDSAGQKAIISAIPVLLSAGLTVEVLKIPEKKDPDDYIKDYGSEAYQSLLTNNVQDPYQYQYELYRENLDLNNSNDIKTFQANVTRMLQNASPAIVSLYTKRIADELQINEKDVKIVKKPNLPVIDIPEEAKGRDKLPDRYEQAERRLLFLMMRSKEWSDRINDRLTVHEYSTPLLGTFRTKLISYYNITDSFSLSEFKEYLNEEEINYFDNVMSKDDFWRNSVIYTSKEIEDYLELLKSTPLLRREIYLKERILEKNRNNEDIRRETEELIKIKKELRRLKEDINGNR